MQEWIDVASKFGIPVGLLLLIGYFLLKHLWPFAMKQFEDAKAERKAEMEMARAERKEELAKFLDTIRARDVLMADIQERHLKALDAITGEMRGLREEVRKR